MTIRDIYTLKVSRPIKIKPRKEATVNLKLVKVPPCYNTILTGKVSYRNIAIKNANVIVLDKNNNQISRTLTDENGIYKFINILKPGKYNVIASAIGYNISNIRKIVINEKIPRKLSFRMKKNLININGILYGKILETGSRKPIENADVYMKTLEKDCEKVYKTTSNEDGEYLIYNILPDNYKIEIKKQGYKKVESLKLKIEKYDRILLYFDLTKNQNYNKSTISGTITFEEKPISEVAVFLYLLDKEKNEEIIQIQESNKDGFYIFSNVEKGCYIVKAKLQQKVIYEKKFVIE